MAYPAIYSNHILGFTPPFEFVSFTPDSQIVIGGVDFTTGLKSPAWNIPYFAGERYFIDLLGKSDKVVARQAPQVVAGFFELNENYRPGHNKWDYEYSIGQLRPDVIAQLWGDTGPAEPYLQADYVQVELDGIPMWFLRDSPHINWDVVE